MKILETLSRTLCLLTLCVSAHAFTAKDVVSGKQIPFPNENAKASVVVFLSAKCPCSASHEKDLAELSKVYQNKGYEFIAVHSNQDEGKEMTLAHFKNSALPFPVVQDEGSQISNEFKALKTPHAFIQVAGKTVFEGGVDDSADAARASVHFLKDALEALDAGKPIKIAKARALGCAIKR